MTDKKLSNTMVSIDDILGPNIDLTASLPLHISSKNTNKFNNINNITNINISEQNRIGRDINIDNILNNGLLNFDNKNQTSMFFITYKSLDAIYKELHNTYNFTIPKELVEKAINDIIPTIIKEYTGNMKKRCKKIINQDMVCLGRKLDNKQCSRKKHNGTDFCKSHSRKLSNGRIDQPSVLVNRNKRGRKRKVQFDPRQYDNEYVTLWEDIVDGHKVLVDNNNNVYTFNLEHPVYIGKKDINLKIDMEKINANTANTENAKEIIKNQEINIDESINNLVIDENPNPNSNPNPNPIENIDKIENQLPEETNDNKQKPIKKKGIKKQ